MENRIHNRYQAFGVHLVISLVIFLILASMIIFFWYPGFLFSMDGGWQGIRLIAGVDLVIGPCLTLFVYKKGKPKLKFDLICISAVQIACLIAGVYIVYQERPVAIVFADDTFYALSKSTLQASRVDYHDIEGVNPWSPTWIYIQLPEDAAERRRVIAAQVAMGPLYAHTERYAPFRDNVRKVLAEGMQVDQLTRLDDEPSPDKDIKYFRLVSRYRHGYLGLRDPTGEPVAALKSTFKINL